MSRPSPKLNFTIHVNGIHIIITNLQSFLLKIEADIIMRSHMVRKTEVPRDNHFVSTRDHMAVSKARVGYYTQAIEMRGHIA